MGANIETIMKAVEGILDLKKKIEKQIKREKDAKIRKKIHAAADKAMASGDLSDLAALRDMLHES